MTDTVEVHLANRTVNLTPTERDEWARRAIKVFQGMEYLMTAFSRVLTGNPTIRLAMTSGTPHTDGKTIYYRPPLLLGDPSPHVRSQCDRRDHYGHLTCPACSAREYVVRSITHEISHIAGDSFRKADPATQETTIRRAVQAARNPIARAHLEAALRGVQWGADVQEIMHKLSPFMHIVLLALEDARIDMRMFKARPGTRKMFESVSKRLMDKGYVDLDGTVVRWADRPLNAQIIIGLLCTAERFDLGELHDKIIQDLKDPLLQDICSRVDRSGGPLDIASLAVECLCRLWEMGYCEPPEEMPPPPPYEPPSPPAEEEPEDKSDEDEPDSEEDADEGNKPSGDAADRGEQSEADSGEQSDSDVPGESGDSSSAPDDSGAEESSDEDPQRPGTDEGSGEPGRDDSEPGDPQSDSTSEEPGGSAEPDNGAGAVDVPDSTDDGSGGESPDAEDLDDGETDGSAGGDADDIKSTPDGDDADGDAEADHGQDGDGRGDPDRSGDEPGGSGSDEPESAEADDHGEEVPDSEGDGDPSDGGNYDLADDQAGDGGEYDVSPDEGDRREADGPEQPESMEVAGCEPSADASEAGSDPGGADVTEVGSDDHPVGSGDPGQAIGDEGTGDSASGVPASDEADGSSDKDSVTVEDDSGAGVDEPEPADLPDDGTADDVAELIQDFTGHNHDDDEQVHLGMPDAAAEAAIDKAIIQNKNFDMPTATVYDVEVYTWPEHDYKCEAWARYNQAEDLTLRIGAKDRAGNDKWDLLRTPEEILQPALFEMRRVFSDNRRTRFERNIKKGKLDGRALGRRAWKGDDLRLFQRQERPKERSYAAIIAGDISWSTHGAEIVVEKQAMFSQAELCHRMGIDFEVWAHTADTYDGPLAKGNDEDAYVMQMHRVKSWTDPWNQKTQEGLAWLHSVSTNLDGHTLEFYRKRLMLSKATTKILLYYTDGAMPAANYEDELEVLKREVDLYKRMGIIMLGVGVGTDSPRRWGMDTVRINNKGDIIKVVKHLEGCLTGLRR